MDVTFPGESAEYRAARNDLLTKEIELRREMEAVAEARRELPPGGEVPEDYVFQGEGADGKPMGVRLSELFAPGKDSLAIYSFMFPRDPEDDGPARCASRRPRSSRWRRALALRAWASSINSMGWSSTPAST